jgi:hypothetical protein
MRACRKLCTNAKRAGQPSIEIRDALAAKESRASRTPRNRFPACMRKTALLR